MGVCKGFVQSYIILFTCIVICNAAKVCDDRYKDNVKLETGLTCLDHTTRNLLPGANENQNGLASFCHYFYRNTDAEATLPENKPPTRRGGARGLNNLEILDMLSVLDPAPDETKYSDWKKDIEMGLSYIRNDNFKYALAPYKSESGLNYKESFLPYRSIMNTTRAPDIGSPNPWFVEASGISIKGDLLHNWLHFRVFMNRSVRDERPNKLHTEKERRHRSTGYISAMIMMIKDQEGYPIGDFSQELPCHKTCRSYSQPVHYGNQENAVPCAYTPPRATSHPGMFVFDVDPGNYAMPPLPELEIETTTPNVTNTTEASENITTTPIPTTTTPEYDELYRKSGVREVHATWSFNQDLCNFVSEIHVQTLIFEEFYGNQSKMCSKDGNYCRYYGWSAQYNILYPKGKESLGAADYVNINYWKNRDKTLGTKEIDCHVPFFDALKTVQGPFIKGVSPYNIYVDTEDFEGLKTVSEVIKVPNKFIHLAAIHRETFGVINPASEEFPQYYGVANLHHFQPPTDGKDKGRCRNAELLNIHPVAADYLKGISSRSAKTGMVNIKDFLETNKGVKCPCPALPSPEPIEQRTADPARLHGRLIHASHMAIAYMFLVPLSCFVARYYKETFITVFCFQEYWWFMWHVVLLMIAATFTFGAVIALYRSGAEKLYVSNNLLVHKIMGFFSITVFAIEIVTGFFRRANPAKRLKQIFFHWLIGNLNIFCAVGSMFAMAFESASGMSCDVVYTMVAWLFFVILWFVILDLHIKHVDKGLDLQPPRSYLPPPVVRLFNRDAPGKKFRMIMLLVYIVNLLIIQYFMSFYLWHSEGKTICYQEWKSFLSGPSTLSLEDIEDDEYNFDEE